MATDPKFWQTWRDELRGEAHEATREANICGFWRIVGAKTKPDFPVAIWPDREGAVANQRARIGAVSEASFDEGSVKWHEFIGAGWTKCVPVLKADYDIARETGFWPDGKKARELTAEEEAGLPKAGGNNPPGEASLAEAIKSLAETLEADAKEPIATKEAGDAIADRLARMRKLLELADAERTKEKQPFLDGGREVDGRWNAVRQPGIDAGTHARKRVDDYLRQERMRLEEEQRKEDEARRLEARRRAEQLAEAAGADERETAAFASAAEKTVPVAAPVKVSLGGATGRATTARKKRVGYVDDAKELVLHLIEVKDEDLQTYLKDRAQKAATAKITLPGCHYKDE